MAVNFMNKINSMTTFQLMWLLYSTPIRDGSMKHIKQVSAYSNHSYIYLNETKGGLFVWDTKQKIGKL